MSKTKKANGFLHFMLDYRRDQAAKGNDIDMIESQKQCGALWDVSQPEIKSFAIKFNLKLCRKWMQMSDPNILE